MRILGRGKEDSTEGVMGVVMWQLNLITHKSYKTYISEYPHCYEDNVNFRLKIKLHDHFLSSMEVGLTRHLLLHDLSK